MVSSRSIYSYELQLHCLLSESAKGACDVVARFESETERKCFGVFRSESRLLLACLTPALFQFGVFVLNTVYDLENIILIRDTVFGNMPSVSLARANSAMSTSFPTSCTFPVEVLDQIMNWAVIDEPDFSTIAGFSLASYQFRQIALRQYFARLYAHSKESWHNLCQIPGIYSWVRDLDCLSTSILSDISHLLHFSNLQHVHVDFSPEGLHTQRTCIRKILKCLPAELTSLELSYLPKLDVDLLHRVAKHFAHLTNLKLTCSERLINDCCWACYEESSSCTIHSPIPDNYVDVDDLTYAFGVALKPLRDLQTLHLGIYLSDLDIFYYHVLHSQMEPVQPAKRVWPHAPNECSHCRDMFSDEVRTTELYASAAIARFLPNIKNITWSSFFTLNEPGDCPENQTTTMWVLRKDKKVKVRRAAW